MESMVEEMIINKLKILLAKIIGKDLYDTYKVVSDICQQTTKQSEFIIYGMNKNSLFLARYLNIIGGGRKIKYFIEDAMEERYLQKIKIESPEKLLTEDLNNVKIVIVDRIHAVRKMERLFELGIESSSIFYFAKGDLLGAKAMNVYDINLGYSRIDDLPGFSVFGDINDWDHSDAVCIVTLGGSTTDATFNNIKSWSEILYERLQEMGIKAVVLCGGMCGYRSSQELLKLIRDVIPLKPYIVINYSGVNDRPEAVKVMVKDHPFVYTYQKEPIDHLIKHKMVNSSTGNLITQSTVGLEDTRTSARRWMDNMKMIHALCNEFEIEQITILQPCMIYGGYIIDENDYGADSSSLKVYSEGLTEWYDQIRHETSNIDYIFDFSMIFSGMRHIYTDPSHVFEKGNRIIANNILRIILPILRRRKQK